MLESAHTESFSPRDDPQVDYRPIDRWAVMALILGLLSSLAMLQKVLWLVPPLGIAISLVSLGRLKQNTNLIGRKAALTGLALSVLFGIAPMAQIASSHVLLSRQGQVVADRFFEYLRQRSPEKALALQYTPDYRQPADEGLWTFYRHDKDARAGLLNFVANPTVRALLELGDKAEVRPYKTYGVATEGSRAHASYYYTVTYPDQEGNKKTFFVAILLERRPTKKPGLNPWFVNEIAGGFNPAAPAEHRRP